MRILKTQVLLRLLNNYLVDSPEPANISYLWNFGSLLAICLGIQILTGAFLAMHYTPNVDLAFNSVEHIMRDVNNGWLIRYTHANVASFFFLFVYLHIARGLYYGSYKSPRVLVWSIGVIILILMMAIGFLGYVLPYGQMSLWGATVITNLLSAIPIFGQDIVEFIWGGFSVNNATLNRFFSLHYLLPFVLAALTIAHVIALHEHGSNNPNGVASSGDRLAFHPYFIFKDLVTIFAFFLALSIMVFFYPNFLGHSDNYIPADPMVTPVSIVPEWYLLPFYAILRSIPNKLLGVIAMFGSLLILLILPITDLSRTRGNKFRPAMKYFIFFFYILFLYLGWLGNRHPETPYVELGQIATAFYFSWFLIIVPVIGLCENTLFDVALEFKENQMNKDPKMNKNTSLGTEKENQMNKDPKMNKNTSLNTEKENQMNKDPKMNKNTSLNTKKKRTKLNFIYKKYLKLKKLVLKILGYIRNSGTCDAVKNFKKKYHFIFNTLKYGGLVLFILLFLKNYGFNHENIYIDNFIIYFSPIYSIYRFFNSLSILRGHLLRMFKDDYYIKDESGLKIKINYLHLSIGLIRATLALSVIIFIINLYGLLN